MGRIVVQEEDTQTTPPTGYSKMYPKSDGKWYFKDDTGTEKEFGADHAPQAHAATHKGGGSDAIDEATTSVNGLMSSTDKTKLDGVATGADVTGSNAPQAHASSHASGGSDAVKLDDLASPDDNTDLNATTSAHGLLPKLGGGSTNFLRADGTWNAPTPGAHGSTHENGGADEISVAGLSGVLADEQDAGQLKGNDIVVTTPSRLNALVWEEDNEEWVNEKLPGVPYGWVLVEDTELTWTQIKDDNYKFIPVNTDPQLPSHVGNGTVSYLNGISATTGDTYTVTDTGTLTAGSLAVVPGDVVMWYSGVVWVKAAAANEDNYVTAGLMVILSTTTALISPYTDGTDDGKLIGFKGTDLVGIETSQDITITLPAPEAGLTYNDGVIRGMYYVGKMGAGGTVTIECAGTEGAFMDGLNSIVLTEAMSQCTLAVVHAALASVWMRISAIENTLQVRRAATWAASNFATAAAIPFDTEDQAGNSDISDWDSGTNPSRVTAKFAHKYTMSGFLSLDYTANAEYGLQAWLAKNGTEITGTRILTGGYRGSTSITWPEIEIELAVDDYVEIFLVHSNVTGNLAEAALILRTVV